MGAAVTVAESDNAVEEEAIEGGGGDDEEEGGILTSGAAASNCGEGLSVRRVMVAGFENCRLWRAVSANVAEQRRIVEGMKAGLLAAAR